MIIKVNSRNQITIPKAICEKLKIKVGDRLLVDVQDGIVFLTSQGENYTSHLQGLHCEIWKNIDVEKYLRDEHKAW